MSSEGVGVGVGAVAFVEVDELEVMEDSTPLVAVGEVVSVPVVFATAEVDVSGKWSPR